MTGVIWFVQVVHYPLFDRVYGEGFSVYAASHGRLTTWVVALPMLIELLTGAILLFWRRPARRGCCRQHRLRAHTYHLAFDISATGAATHRARRRFRQTAHRTLVFTNWLRTAAWTSRSLLVAWMVADTMEG